MKTRDVQYIHLYKHSFTWYQVLRYSLNISLIKMESSKPNIDRLDNSSPDYLPSKILNINIGVLGHIDSGKTSLCKALSTI